MPRGKGKGSQFERDICRRLSHWWSENTRDDLFWRTAGSGARATSRGKKGKTTYGQSGDLAATDPAGFPLINLLTIELKRGYSKDSIMDLFDRRQDAAIQCLECWIEQCRRSSSDAGTYSWLLIHQRDRRVPLVYFPSSLHSQFKLVDPFFCLSNKMTVTLPVRNSEKEVRRMSLCCTSLGEFLTEVKPDHIRTLAKKMES